jgi:three-Cys-motif partner protein
MEAPTGLFRFGSLRPIFGLRHYVRFDDQTAHYLVPFPPREAQTRIKHQILAEYVGAWSGIISSGIGSRPRRASFTTDFVYADGFAGSGEYEYDLADPEQGPVPGSPLIAMDALRRAEPDIRLKGVTPRTSGIFIESNREFFDELCRHAEDSLPGWPKHMPSSIRGIELGAITAVHGDFRNNSAGVPEVLPERAFLLVLVDPYGTSAHMDSLVHLLRRKRTDLIVFFPSHEVQLHGAAINKPNLSPQERANTVARVEAVFGGDCWEPIARRTELSAQERIDLYADLYQGQLKSFGRDYWVKKIALRFSASPASTPGYHLFLVTDSADGAMRMNDILRKAEIRKHVAHLQDLEQRIHSRGNLELGLDLESTAPGEEVVPDLDEVIRDVEAVLPKGAGTEVVWKELKGRLADTIYLESEIKRALTKLKRSGRITYDSVLRKDSPIRVLR